MIALFKNIPMLGLSFLSSDPATTMDMNQDPQRGIRVYLPKIQSVPLMWTIGNILVCGRYFLCGKCPIRQGEANNKYTFHVMTDLI
jgi:hypothetical protein